MTSEEFEKACQVAVRYLRQFAPNPVTRAKRESSGDLAFNAIKYEMPDPDTFIIYVDESIASYMPYTNEPWISYKWGGKKNPNEGWWQRAAAYVAMIVAQVTGGELREGGNT